MFFDMIISDIVSVMACDMFVRLQRILAFLHQQEMLLVDTADNLARMARETLVHARYAQFMPSLSCRLS